MIVTVFALKGGVGKTFVSINLARKLSEDHRVLLLELDYQESVPVFFGFRPEVYLSDVLMDPSSLRRALVSIGGVDVLPGGPGLFKLEFEAGSKILSNFSSLLTAVSRAYGVVVVDTHNVPGLLTEAVLGRSDVVVVPVRPGVLNMVGLQLTLNLLNKIGQRNRSMRVVGVLNGVRRNVRSHREFMSSISSMGIFIHDYIPYSAVVERGEAGGLPVYSMDLRFLSPFEELVSAVLMPAVPQGSGAVAEVKA
ncbi:MAG: ParA family protein [Infirmifilum sp.]